MFNPFRSSRSAQKKTAKDMAEASRRMHAMGLDVPAAWKPGGPYAVLEDQVWTLMEALFSSITSSLSYPEILEQCTLLNELWQDIQNVSRFLQRQGRMQQPLPEKFGMLAGKACIYAAGIWEYGLAGSPSFEKAMEWYRRGCRFYPYYEGLKDELAANSVCSSPADRLCKLSQGRLMAPFEIPFDPEEERKKITELVEQEKRYIDKNLETDGSVVRGKYECTPPAAKEALHAYTVQKLLEIQDYETLKSTYLFSTGSVREAAGCAFALRAYQEGFPEDAAQTDTAIGQACLACLAYEKHLSSPGGNLDLVQAKLCSAHARGHMQNGQKLPAELETALDRIDKARQHLPGSRSLSKSLRD